MADDDDVVCPLPALRKRCADHETTHLHGLLHATRPPACEPRCADVFKHYLACADRIEQKGAGDCEPYYFDWLKCIDKCAMPHIMQKLK